MAATDPSISGVHYLARVAFPGWANFYKLGCLKDLRTTDDHMALGGILGRFPLYKSLRKERKEAMKTLDLIVSGQSLTISLPSPQHLSY